MKIVTNLKDKMTERKECQWVTKAIPNKGLGGNLKVNTSNEN